MAMVGRWSQRHDEAAFCLALDLGLVGFDVSKRNGMCR